MPLQLKPLAEQVMVITGATSGIGLVTARMAAQRGARLVLIARNSQALQRLVEEIGTGGGEAISITADVGNQEQVRQAAASAVDRFGGIDTWINNAGVSVYGRVEEIPQEDARRLFDTNFWGTVNGSLAAAEYMRIRGGALINVGSVVSDRALPLQGMYCASKHAVKGFTDSLRMELEKDGAPISVTLIKPSSIDTPFTKHAKNYMLVEPKYPPPVYTPDLVAEAILDAAQRPVRDLTIGGGGKAIAWTGSKSPALTDKLMKWTMFDSQQTERPAGRLDFNNLYGPSRDLEERGDYPGHVCRTSAYTQGVRNPALAGALMLAAGFVFATLLGHSHD